MPSELEEQLEHARNLVVRLSGPSETGTGDERVDELIESLGQLVGGVDAARLTGATACKRNLSEIENVVRKACHELRSPLHALVGYSSLLSDSMSVNSEHLEQMMWAGRRMQAIIRSLSAWGKVLASPQMLASVDVVELVKEVLANLGPLVAVNNTEITWDEFSEPAFGDRSQLNQVFENLVDNGIRFRGAEAQHIHIAGHRTQAGWTFSVTDHGMGCEKRDYERIFGAFETLNTDEAYSGVGMGLTICKTIVEGHKGRIWVESEPGVGSTFRFTIATP